MNSVLTLPRLDIAPALDAFVKQESSHMPITIARVLTPIMPELGNVHVIHPTDNDPVLVSDKLGSVAIWLDF